MCVAPTHDHLVAKVGQDERPLIDVISRPTAVMDIVGLPAVTIPAGFDDDGLPLGIQIASRPYDELSCLSVAHAYQQLTEFHTALPPIVQEDLHANPNDGLDELPPTLTKPVMTMTRDRIW
jgi:Asp-tRNA(Asn)/Glu-tRNA(Gln) amidotransferase A subunit family amidase